MINMELRKYIECTYEEKKPLVKLIQKIILLANVARMEGVLALDQRLEKLEENLLRSGLALVVEGTDPVIVKETMDMLIVTSFKTGAELLSQLIIRNGVISIQLGHDPRIIKEQLKALLGDEFINQELSIKENM